MSTARRESRATKWTGSAGAGPGRGGQGADWERHNAELSPERNSRPGGRRNNVDSDADWELGEES